jgi:hypothetical protein
MSKEKINVASSVTPIEVPHISKTVKEAAKDKLKEFMNEEIKMVKGMFQNFETPGASATITVRKYPGIPPFTKCMQDGFIYEVPLYVARFLNGTDVTAGALGDPNKKNTSIGTCSYGVSGFKMQPGAEPQYGVETVVNGVGAPTVAPITAIIKRVRRFGFQSTEFGG